MILPAYIAKCDQCARLITVDALNPAGHCTDGCPGRAADQGARVSDRAMEAIDDRYGHALDELAVAHSCPSVWTGNPADCAFGNRGCRP